jgi:hypothetical protein
MPLIAITACCLESGLFEENLPGLGLLGGTRSLEDVGEGALLVKNSRLQVR